MVRFDLTRSADRLAVAEQSFSYPTEPHRRKHGPSGYSNYESYRDWLRDEFSFRCVFSLIREQWVERIGNFDIDHLRPRSEHPEQTQDYDNLLYLTHRMNLIRGRRELPDPGVVALGRCLKMHHAGEQMGEIVALNPVGERIVRILRLDSEEATTYRRKLLGVLRHYAIHDEHQFREWIGYPSNLPNLRSKRLKAPNTRASGLAQSAHELKALGQLPEWY